MRLGFISVNDPNAAAIALTPANVSPGDVTGEAMAQANMQIMANAKQLIPGISNTALAIGAIGVLVVLVILAQR
jgi:hypothetical protein